MSRNEAIRVYLDVQLGFRCAYDTFLAAASLLTETERQLLHSAVAGAGSGETRAPFFKAEY